MNSESISFGYEDSLIKRLTNFGTDLHCVKSDNIMKSDRNGQTTLNQALFKNAVHSTNGFTI